jgi:transposase-like protein
MSAFTWNDKSTIVALALANGKTQKQAAEEADISDRTVRRWLLDPDFSAEVDRLSLMTDIAGRAERLRLAKRAVRQAIDDDGKLTTKADVLDWLKYAQSETDGIKLDLTKLSTALGKAEASMADSGSD